LSGFKVISDSACDLPSHVLSEHEIDIVPFYVTADGKSYLKDQVEITTSDFYRQQRTGKVFFKTSLPSVQDYLDVFRKYVGESDILCLNLSSGLSGSHQSAATAAQMIREEYPERTVIALDTQNASIGQGWKVLEAARCSAKGHIPQQVVELLSKNAAHIVLAVDDLDYLLMGGRISKVTAFAGGLLHIKPLIKLQGGVLLPHGRARGRSKAISALMQVLEDGIGAEPSAYHVSVIHSDCAADADLFRAKVEEHFKSAGDVTITEVGLVIGAHIGPAVIAVAYLRKTCL
jgi:DegV family protein with EDD domain